MSKVQQVGATRPAAVDDGPGAEHKPSGAQRLLHVVGAVLVALVLPALVIGAFAGELGVAAMFTGLLFGATGSKIGGTRRLLYIAPALGVAGGLGAYTAYAWWWVALLTTAAVITGAGIRFGWFAALLMIPYAATFVTPVSTVTDAVIYGAILAVAAGYGIVLARRFAAPAVVDGDHLPPGVAAVVAIGFGVVLGASAAVGVALDWTEPYWVPEPVLILVLYIVTGKRDRIRGKAIGTAFGVAAAVPVAIVSPPAGVLTALGAIAFIIALTQAKTYWLMYGLYTFSLVLLLSAPGQVGFEAEERGVQILVGIGLLVVGLAIVHAIGARVAKRYPQPELAPA
jgi:hypothetical protein